MNCLYEKMNPMIYLYFCMEQIIEEILKFRNQGYISSVIEEVKWYNYNGIHLSDSYIKE